MLMTKNPGKTDTEADWVKRRNRVKKYRRFLLLLICIILCGIVLYNNRDWIKLPVLFAGKPAEQVEESPVLPPVQETAAVQRSDSGADTGLAGKKGAVSEAVQPDSLVLSDVRCKISGRDDLTIYLTVAIFFNNDALYQEILLKRDDLKVMALNVMRRKEYGSIQTEPLRAELKEAMDDLLEAGDLENLEIRDFRLE